MSLDIPEVLFLYGDAALAKKDINKIKKKYNDSKWLELSLKDDNLDSIRGEVGFLGFGIETKIVLIYNLVSTKLEREFLLDICKQHASGIRLIIWDSAELIKIDPKTKSPNETWKSLIQSIKSLEKSKIINYGDDFSEKEEDDVISYITNLFAKHNKKITNEAALTMLQIVGRKRSMLSSEVDKLSLVCPNPVTEDFILEACFPSSQEAVLWRLGNIIDNCNFLESIKTIKEFIANGVHINVLAEIMAKKARWQLAASHLWASGFSWAEVEATLSSMGKFPSVIWHNNNLSLTEKKMSEQFKDVDAAYEFLNRQLGIPSSYLYKLKEKGAKIKGAEALPMPFLASFIVRFIQNKIIAKNKNNYNESELKSRVLARAVKTYNQVTDKLKEVRYNNLEQDIFDMVRVLVDTRI